MWNWNSLVYHFARNPLCLLIVPMWNWNCMLLQAPCIFEIPFNRTNVELKLNRLAIYRRPYLAFNRTNVELKCDINKAIQKMEYAFNRTNVELKLKHVKISHKKRDLLIVPMWNWNTLNENRFGEHKWTFNRTNVELK